MTEKLLVPPDEAAERLGVSRRQLYRLINEGRVRSVKIGRLRRISLRALQDFVERAENETAGAPS